MQKHILKRKTKKEKQRERKRNLGLPPK